MVILSRSKESLEDVASTISESHDVSGVECDFQFFFFLV